MSNHLQPRFSPGPLTVPPESFPAAVSLPPSVEHVPTVADLMRIFLRRLWVVLLIMAVAIAAAVYITKKTAPTWQAHAQMILIEHANTSIITSQDSAPVSSPVQESVETQMTMIQDQEMARRALSQLSRTQTQTGSSDALSLTPTQVEKSIDVTNPKDTDLIDLYVKADSPDRARMLANSICVAFMAWKKEIAQHNSKEALARLNVRVDRAKADMTAAETAELKYRMAHKLVDAPIEQTSILNQELVAEAQVATLQQQLAADKAHLASLSGRLQVANADLNNGIGVSDPSQVMALQAQLNALETERAQKALLYTKEYPGVLPQLDAEIKDLHARLTKAIHASTTNKTPDLQAQAKLVQDVADAKTDVALSQTKLAAAQKDLASLKARTVSLPEKGLDDGRLARTVELRRQLYTSLQSSLNAARLEKDAATSNVQLVQSASVDPRPIDPNPIRNLGVGLAVGIILSLAAVMLLEQTDRRVRDLEGLRPLTAGPIIGALPQMSRAQIAALRSGRPSLPDAEAYNMASANLSLTLRSTGEWDNRIVLVTSALPGEGKSVTAAAMARSLAQTGRRVVLIDADLRRPAQGKLFVPKETAGLADVLEGKVRLWDALQPTEYHNLQVLHSGNVDRNPTELLSRPQMAHVLLSLKQSVDVVLVDTPACSVVADALILAPHADCVLHVVGAGIVDQEEVRSATASLMAAAPKAMAYIVNRAPRSRNRNNSYYTAPQPGVASPVMNTGEAVFTRTMELRLAELAEAWQEIKAEKNGQNGALPHAEDDVAATVIMPRPAALNHQNHKDNNHE